jgi:large subunit ribosomal protein L3
MRKGILGRKVGMTQIFQPDGSAVPVTVIEAGPCKVLQVKTVDRDGYDAVQLGFLDKPRRLASRSERGHVADISSKRSAKLQASGVAVAPKAGGEPKRFVKELRGEAGFAVGQEVLASILDGVKVHPRVAGTPAG